MLKKAAFGLLMGTFLIASPAVVLADTNASVETAVRTYFADEPVMINIASCESQFTQFNTDGSALHGGYKHTMIGIYQIAPLHLPDAISRGYDVKTVAGNMSYAKYLYETYGTSPWLDSMHCWGKMSLERKPSTMANSLQGQTASGDIAFNSDKVQDLKWQIARLQAVISAMVAAQSTT